MKTERRQFSVNKTVRNSTFRSEKIYTVRTAMVGELMQVLFSNGIFQHSGSPMLLQLDWNQASVGGDMLVTVTANIELIHIN